MMQNIKKFNFFLKAQRPLGGGGSIPILITPIPYVNSSPQNFVCDASKKQMNLDYLKNRSNTI